MKVTDTISVNTGTLNSWSLEVCGRPLEVSPSGDEPQLVTKSAGKVVVDWWPYPGLNSYKVYRASSASAAASFANVTPSDPNPTDTRFEDASAGALYYYLITGVSPRGESPWGHYGQ